MIPLRPEGYAASGLTQDEQSALTWFVISGCSRKDAFLLFARPDMAGSKSKPAIDDYVKQFFSRKDVKDYLDAYKQTLDEFIHPSDKPKEQVEEIPMDQRMALSRAKLVEFAMQLIDNIEEAQDPESVLKMADKLGLLDSDADAPEEPRRYLPEACNQCAYRKFCEENSEDMCIFCKYRQFAERSGIHFDKENMLNTNKE